MKKFEKMNLSSIDGELSVAEMENINGGIFWGSVLNNCYNIGSAQICCYTGYIFWIKTGVSCY